MSAGIRATGLAVRVGGREVLQDVDLELVPGRFTAVLGPNGAGKSTLLDVLAGTREPQAGGATIDGEPVHGRSHAERSRLIGVLTQQNAVSFPFLVEEVVAMGRAPWARRSTAAEDDAAIADAIRDSDVGHLVGRRLTELSGGERARVSLARVLAQATPIVLLDEPTAALDLKHQEAVMRIALGLARAGRAVAAVLHDLSLAAAYADEIVLLDHGRLAAAGAPREVLTAATVQSVYDLPVDIEIGANGRPTVTPRRQGA